VKSLKACCNVKQAELAQYGSLSFSQGFVLLMIENETLRTHIMTLT